MNIRPDNIKFSSLTPSMIGLGSSNGYITVSGTVASGNTATFSTTISLLSNNNFADVYAINPSLSNPLLAQKVRLVAGNDIGAIYANVSAEYPTNIVQFSSNSVYVEIDIFNGTGASITLITVTYTIEVVEYKAPF